MTKEITLSEEQYKDVLLKITSVGTFIAALVEKNVLTDLTGVVIALPLYDAERILVNAGKQK